MHTLSQQIKTKIHNNEIISNITNIKTNNSATENVELQIYAIQVVMERRIKRKQYKPK